MKKISFVLPCYNVEKYLSECLDSIFLQGVSEEEFEVICVNDCSTDNTWAILNEYHARYQNIRLINHEQNLTAGGARNTGIDNSRGEFIWFVDPDDRVYPHSLEFLLSFDCSRIDFLMFNNVKINESGVVLSEEKVFSDVCCERGQDFVTMRFQGQFSKLSIVWRCLFRRSFLNENNLRFPILRKSQDTVFMCKCLLSANSVSSIHNLLYVYRVNPSSIANYDTRSDVAFVGRILLGREFVLIEKTYDGNCASIEQGIHNLVLWCANDNMSLLSKMDRKSLTDYYHEMKSNKNAVLSLMPYMNQKSLFLYRGNGCYAIWLIKVAIMRAFLKLQR